MNKGVAIVSSGGGMRCAYSAGVFYGLLEKYPDFEPEILIGSSGSSANVCYYATKQYKEIKQVWTRELHNSGIVSRFGFRINVDYIIDNLLKKKWPLNLKKLKDSKTKVYVAVTNVSDGKTEYLTPNECDIFEALRAAKAIPFFYDEKVMINGNSYIDSDISSNVIKNSLKAISEGAKKIIIIDNNHTISSSLTFLRLYSFLFNRRLKKILDVVVEEYNEASYPSDVSVLYIRPSNLSLGVCDVNKKRIESAFNSGYNDLYSNNKIDEFLFGSQKSILAHIKS